MNAKHNFKYFLASFCLAFSCLTVFLFLIISSKPIINRQSYPNNEIIYLPDKNDNFTLLIGVSENKVSSPFKFYLVYFDFIGGKTPVIHLNSNLFLPNINTTLENSFKNNNFKDAIKNLEILTQIAIDKYICLNKASFEYITEICGNISVNIPAEIYISSDLALKTGKQILNGGLIFKILKTNDDNISSEILSELINLIFPLLNSAKGERTFNFLVNNCVTDISYKDFQKVLRPIAFLGSLNSAPAFPLTLNGKNNAEYFYFNDFSLKSLKEIIY